MNNPSKFLITPTEKNYIDSIFEKIADAKRKSEFRVISFDSLYKLLDKNEKGLIKRLIQVDPIEYGFKGKYFGIQEVPNDLVAIADQKYNLTGEIKTIDTQFLPKPAYSAYLKLNESLYQNKKRKLLVLSGYRSPAYQAFVFLWYLRSYKYDFSKTIKRAAIPGYSEHGFPEKQAIDFMTKSGSPSEKNPEDFEKTIEYAWLLENANKFNFYLTNPKNNTLGTMYEPWHWAFIKGL